MKNRNGLVDWRARAGGALVLLRKQEPSRAAGLGSCFRRSTRRGCRTAATPHEIPACGRAAVYPERRRRRRRRAGRREGLRHLADAELAELAVEGGAADAEAAGYFGHAAAIMADGEADH